ncbi:hypothetical protein PG984_014279 [Apiospora sp. TS-2023a]
MAWAWNTLDDVPSDGPKITAIAIAFTTVSLLLVVLRAYVRFFLVKAVGADDWVIFTTWFACCGFAVATIIQTKWGLGLLVLSDMPDEDVYNFGVLQYIAAPFYITSILGFKLSLLLSYLRIIPGRGWRITIIIVAVACTMFHTSFLMVQIFLCTPVAKQWDPAITEGSCIPPIPCFTSMASFTIFFDLIVMFLPFPTLIRSRIQKRRKAVLLGLFATGLFITVTQILRIQTIYKLVDHLDSAPIIMWSAVENNLGVIITCIPTLAPLVKLFAEKASSSGSGSGGVDSAATGAAAKASSSSSSPSSSYALQSLQPSSGAGGRKGKGDGRKGGLAISREVSVTTCSGGSSTTTGKNHNNESQESMIQHHHHHPEHQGRVIMRKKEFHMVHETAPAT